MERRTLLRSAALGVTIGMLPAWIRRAFAADEGCDDRSAVEVRAAIARARRRGVPVLVLVVPTDPGKRWLRSGHFGELIDLGPASALAAMALAEVVCASLAAVRCAAPGAPVDRHGETPMFLVVDTDRPNFFVTQVWVEIPSSRAPEPGWSEKERVALWQHEVRDRLARMTRALRRALAGTDLTRRARQNFDALAAGDRARLLEATSDGGATLPLALESFKFELCLCASVSLC